MSTQTHAEPFAVLIGLDWADEQHDVAIKTLKDGEVHRKTIPHTPEDLAHWVQELRERFSGGLVAICLEQSRGALINALMKYEFIRLYPIPPARLAQYREAMTSSGAKSDPVDTDLMLDFLEKHRDQLREWKPDDELTRTIASLSEQRRQWVNDRTRLSNRLKMTLKGYFPHAIQWLNDTLYTLLACDFLLRWPTLESLQHARPHTIRKFFYAHNARRPDRINELLQQLPKAEPLTTDHAIVESSVLQVQGLARQLRQLATTIDGYDKRLEELFSQHEDAPIFTSLPGAGKALAPRLLCAYGTDRDRFPDAASMQVFSGTAPITVGSGTRKDKKKKKVSAKKPRKVRVQRRYACPKFLRQTFHEFAAQSILWSTWARACYQMHRDRGDAHHAAVRALAFTWIRIITRLWHDRQPYDEATYLASLRRRNSPLLAYLPDGTSS